MRCIQTRVNRVWRGMKGGQLTRLEQGKGGSIERGGVSRGGIYAGGNEARE